MNQRVNQLGVSEPQISTAGGNQIIGLAARRPEHPSRRAAGRHDRAARVLRLGGERADRRADTDRRLAADDPEPHARHRSARDPVPRCPGVARRREHAAVHRRAAGGQAARAGRARTTPALGPEYFAFGAPGSAACTQRRSLLPRHPDRSASAATWRGPQDNLADLYASAPHRRERRPTGCRCSPSSSGTVVLQAVPANFSHAPAWSDPTAQFYVLQGPRGAVRQRHHQPAAVAPTSPARPTSRSGSRRLAATSSRTSPRRSPTAATSSVVSANRFNQHFAVALDTQLITVPSIDFKTYPDGIQGNNGAEITGGFTIHLRPGPGDATAPWRAADQLVADLRVAGVGDARQAGAEPGRARRARGACWPWRSSCSPTTACSA